MLCNLKKRNGGSDMIKTLLAQVKQYKSASILAPIFMVGKC